MGRCRVVGKVSGGRVEWWESGVVGEWSGGRVEWWESGGWESGVV